MASDVGAADGQRYRVQPPSSRCRRPGRGLWGTTWIAIIGHSLGEGCGSRRGRRSCRCTTDCESSAGASRRVAHRRHWRELASVVPGQQVLSERFVRVVLSLVASGSPSSAAPRSRCDLVAAWEQQDVLARG